MKIHSTAIPAIIFAISLSSPTIANAYNRDQLKLLQKSVAEWNAMRGQQPELAIDLSKANLEDANLKGANLSKANLSKSDLSGASLDQANLEGANLSMAYLKKTNMKTANWAEPIWSGQASRIRCCSMRISSR